MPVIPSINWLKLLPYLGAILVVVGLVAGVYSLGSSHGEAAISAKWQKQKDADAKFVEKTKAENQQKELAHNDKDRKISDELSDLKETAASDKARIAGELTLRLRDSTHREGLYRVAAEGSAAERERLASYAAQLDRSLSTGISLVDELKAALAVRDGQIKALGSQILNDRQLLNGSGDKNGQLEPAR